MNIKEKSKLVQKKSKSKIITHVCSLCKGTGKIGVGKRHEFYEPCYECGGKKEIPVQW